MSGAICDEARFFLISVLAGSAILFGYGLLRAVRREFPAGNLRMGIEDFFYWSAAGIAFFLVTFWKNSGVLRGFSFLGLLIGMLLYAYLLDRPVVSAAAGLLHILCVPFRFVTKKLGIFGHKVLKKCEKRVKMSLRIFQEKKNRKGRDGKKRK